MFDRIAVASVAPCRGDAALALEKSRERRAAALVLRSGTAPELTSDHVAVAELASGASWGRCHALLLQSIEAAATGGASRLAEDEDLYAFVNVLAEATGGATVIEDVRRRVLAFSTLQDQPIDPIRRGGILDRQMPIIPEAEYEYATIAKHGGAHRFPPLRDRGGRLGIAIRAGGVLLGSIWVVDLACDLPDSALEALAQACDAAALHLLRLEARQEALERSRPDHARHLLHGEVERLRETAWITEPMTAVVAAFDIAAASPGEALGYLRRAAAFTETFLATYARHAAATSLDGRVYVVVPAERAARLLADARAQLERVLHLQTRIGVGGPAEDLAGIPRSRREADEVLDLPVGGPAPGAITTLDEVRSAVLLARLARGPAGTELLTDARLRRLLEHDDQHGTRHLRTLCAYLDAFGDAARVAEAEGVHVNTVRYRLRRLRELAGVDLGDPDDRLVLWLQLRLLGPSRQDQVGRGSPGPAGRA